MEGDLLPILMGLSLIAGIFSGYPVAFVLGGLGIVFLFIGGVPIFTLQLAVSRIIGVMSNWLLLAIPLFVFMGPDARPVRDRGEPALFPGTPAGRRAGRAGRRGGRARHRPGRVHGHRRRVRGHAGRAGPPRHAAREVRPPARGRDRGRFGHAGHPDPAVDHAGRPRFDAPGLGGRPVQGGLRPGSDARPPLCRLHPRPGAGPPGLGTAGQPPGRRARGPGGGAPSAAGSVGPRHADRRGARVHPRGHRDADRGRRAGRGGGR